MIPFNRPYLTGKELIYIRQAHRRAQLAGNGYFTIKCQKWLEKNLGTKKAFLTHSCTSALEMAAILADIKPGDEIIMPSYTFVSTANAFVLRGGVPVFVDIRPDTLNIDEKLIEKAITRRTKAIVPVHYAGVGCEMDTILKIARRYRLLVIEDAAHCVRATYKGRELGTIGDFGALSFHETKNIISGEGGALLINNPKFIKRAEIVWQKGTDRSCFMRGEVDKYTWRDVGSSFLPGELMAAFLWAQLEEAGAITKNRLSVWHSYHDKLAPLEKNGWIRLCVVPKECSNNAHMYYVVFNTSAERQRALQVFRKHNINALFHYIPLHASPAGRHFGRLAGPLPKTDSISRRILRLPLWMGIRKKERQKVINILSGLFS